MIDLTIVLSVALGLLLTFALPILVLEALYWAFEAERYVRSWIRSYRGEKLVIDISPLDEPDWYRTTGDVEVDGPAYVYDYRDDEEEFISPDYELPSFQPSVDTGELREQFRTDIEEMYDEDFE